MDVTVNAEGYESETVRMPVNPLADRPVDLKATLPRHWRLCTVRAEVTTADRQPSASVHLAVVDGDSLSQRFVTDTRGVGTVDIKRRRGQDLTLRLDDPRFEPADVAIPDAPAPDLRLVATPAFSRIVFILNMARRFDEQSLSAAKHGLAALLECVLSEPSRNVRVGLLLWGDAGPRVVLAGDAALTPDAAREAIGEMESLHGQGGALHAGLLEDVARRVATTLRPGARGCDVVVLMPEDVTVERDGSLDRSPPAVAARDFLRRGNMRLTILEIGREADGASRALREFCAGTGGTYRYAGPGSDVRLDLLEVYKTIIGGAEDTRLKGSR